MRDSETLKERTYRIIYDNKDEVFELNLHIFNEPELSSQEEKTSSLYCKKLKERAFDGKSLQ